MSRKQLTLNEPANLKQHPSPKTPPLDSIHYFIDGFLLKHLSQRQPPSTVKFYKENLAKFVWFLEQEEYPVTLEDLTPNHIRHFLIYLQEQTEGRWGSTNWNANKPLAPASVHAFARTLRAFFRWATKE